MTRRLYMLPSLYPHPYTGGGYIFSLKKPDSTLQRILTNQAFQLYSIYYDNYLSLR